MSIQVGMPQTLGDPSAHDPELGPWRTGFFKLPVPGPVQATRLGLQGDGQADLINHGGPDKAILAYAADHYPRWRERLDLPEMSGGAFGENLTIAGLDETQVCIGDTWRIGSAVLQASQPRQPCWKLARRWGLPQLPKLVVQTGRSGWYFRVLEEGTVTAGDDVTLRERRHPAWTIARCSQALYVKSFPLGAAEELSTLPELSDAWREDLIGRLSARS